MANVAAKGRIKYDEANEWPRIKHLLAAQPSPSGYSYTGIMQVDHDEYSVEMSGMFHWHPKGNDKASKDFYDFVHKNMHINVVSWNNTPVNGNVGHIVTFGLMLRPTITFTSYQLTNVILDMMRLWFKIII